jgi:hypothetical protein
VRRPEWAWRRCRARASRCACTGFISTLQHSHPRFHCTANSGCPFQASLLSRANHSPYRLNTRIRLSSRDR